MYPCRERVRGRLAREAAAQIQSQIQWSDVQCGMQWRMGEQLARLWL